MGNKFFNNYTCKGEQRGYECEDCPYFDSCDSTEGSDNYILNHDSEEDVSDVAI